MSRPNFVNDSAQERIDTVNNVLKAGVPYLSEIIDPQLKAVAKYECHLLSLREYAQGCYLMHSPEIQPYTVIKHCFLPDKGNIYVIAVDEKGLHGFFVNEKGWPQGWAKFSVFNETNFERFQCKNSEYIGRTIGDIAEQFHTPPVEILPKFYKFYQ